MSVTALALAQGGAPAGPVPAAGLVAPTPRPTLALADRVLSYGGTVVASGRVRALPSGARLVLQHAQRGRGWRTVAAAVVRPDGRYRAEAPLRASGAVRVLALGSAPESAGGGSAVAASQPVRASRAKRVAVAARLVVPRRGHDVRTGAAVTVRGALLPRRRGRTVAIEGGAHGRWRTLAHAATRAGGRFEARVVAHALGTMRLRVRFAGDRRNAGTRAGAGSLQAYRPSLASWYWLYGSPLACGGTLGYHQLGVAHKTLPCGTKVTLRYRGREVTVPVVDRGPYVGGREWDLTGATARRLGFSGVGTVWSTV